MLWDSGTAKTPMWTERKWHIKYDQLTIYDHVLTMFYGTNTYVWFADHDEMLVLPHHLHHSVHYFIQHGV